MDATFTLDTSGAVPMGRGENMGFAGINLTWDDIGALPYGQLAQGYIEAALRHLWEVEREYHLSQDLPFGWLPAFRFLAPETLAAMLKDCELWEQIMPAAAVAPDADDGREFWRLRQADRFHVFPPLTLHLGDDGLIYFGEAA